MLSRGASADDLVRAAAANQTAWSPDRGGGWGVVHTERGATWMVSRAGAVLAFPELSRERLRRPVAAAAERGAT